MTRPMRLMRDSMVNANIQAFRIQPQTQINKKKADLINRIRLYDNRRQRTGGSRCEDTATRVQKDSEQTSECTSVPPRSHSHGCSSFCRRILRLSNTSALKMTITQSKPVR